MTKIMQNKFLPSSTSFLPSSSSSSSIYILLVFFFFVFFQGWLLSVVCTRVISDTCGFCFYSTVHTTTLWCKEYTTSIHIQHTPNTPLSLDCERRQMCRLTHSGPTPSSSLSKLDIYQFRKCSSYKKRACFAASVNYCSYITLPLVAHLTTQF